MRRPSSGSSAISVALAIGPMPPALRSNTTEFGVMLFDVGDHLGLDVIELAPQELDGGLDAGAGHGRAKRRR